MIDLIEIDGTEYGFLFGMEVYWHFSTSRDIEFDEVNDAVRADYDAIVDLFALANKAANERQGEGKEIDRSKLKIQFDENPELFIELQEKFTASKVFKKLSEAGGKKQGKGKG